jgi:hypothetical protein
MLGPLEEEKKDIKVTLFMFTPEGEERVKCIVFS